MSIKSGKRRIAKAQKRKRRKNNIYIQARKVGDEKVVPSRVWPPRGIGL